MNPFSCITVDNPNIPILSTEEALAKPLGKFIETENSEDDVPDGLEYARSSDMYLPNFSVRSFEGKFSRDAVFVNAHNRGTDLLGSCLFLKGNINSILPGQPGSIESYDKSHNFKFDPHNEFKHKSRAGTEIHFLHISYASSYFNQFLPEDEAWADNLKRRIDRKERIIGHRFVAISHLQERALKNIMDCPLSGKLGYLLIETSIIQIILLQMYSLFNTDPFFKSEKVNKRDMDVITELKEYLSGTFLDDHSLISLSRHFGANTNKLMSLFKKFFGKSIFEYINELRMEHARQLLQDQGLLITEVSRVIGYKNPNHFSAAFKKRYGICPSELK